LREGFCFSCLLLLVLTFVFFRQVLHLAKSHSARQVTHAVELEGANASLRVELEAARSKLVEVEHCERTLTSENECLKKDLEDAHSTHEAAVRDKELVRQTEQLKLRCFQDSVSKRLAELQRDMETSVSALGG
jgi:hypothetical protein